MTNAIILVLSLALAVFLWSREVRPPVCLFVVASAAMWIFLGEKLFFPWNVVSGILWVLAFLAVALLKERQNKTAVSILVVCIVSICCAAYLPSIVSAGSGGSNTSVKSTEVKQSAVDQAKRILSENGWVEGKDYTLSVNEAADNSTSGAGAFSKENIKNPADMVKFLKNNSSESQTIIAELKKQTGANDVEILDAGNWVAIQSMTEYEYPNNTSIQNGSIVDVGARDGSNGDIFFLFVPPNGKSPVPFRGACANPQRGMPTPSKITVTPVTPRTPDNPDNPDNPLTPKDSKDDVTPPQGVTQLPAGEVTNGQQSADQIKSGDTSGVATDKPVGENTKSGDTTTDIGDYVKIGTGDASGGTTATPDDTKDDAKDDNSANYDTGGTNGGTVITDPDANR